MECENGSMPHAAIYAQAQFQLVYVYALQFRLPSCDALPVCKNALGQNTTDWRSIWLVDHNQHSLDVTRLGTQEHGRTVSKTTAKIRADRQKPQNSTVFYPIILSSKWSQSRPLNSCQKSPHDCSNHSDRDKPQSLGAEMHPDTPQSWYFGIRIVSLLPVTTSLTSASLDTH